jgi:hypothetical protein
MSSESALNQEFEADASLQKKEKMHGKIPVITVY